MAPEHLFCLGPAAFLGSRWQAEGPDFPAALVCRQGMVAGGRWDRRPQFSAVSPLQLPVSWRTTAQRWRLRAHVSSWSVRASGNCRWTTVNISSSSCSEEGWQPRAEAKRETLGRLGRPGYQGGVRSHCSKLEISLWLEGNQGTVQHPGRNERQGKKKKLTPSLVRGMAFMSSDKRNKSRMYDKICPGKAYFWAIGTFSYVQCEASTVHFFLFALVVRKAIF